MPPRRWGAVAALVASVGVGGALGAWGLDHGWWWLVHPDGARYPVRGIDVSHHQGPIDWDRVAAGPTRFAWIKATEGADWTDARFAVNRDEAERVGLAWGAYHFFTFCSDAGAQAEHFLRVVGDSAPALPAAIDLETGGNCAEVPPPAELRARVDRFARAVEAATGRAPVLYVVTEQVDALLGAPPTHDLWLRSVFVEPAARPGLRVWQYHSRGAVDGIDGYADLNAFVGTNAEFERWIGADRACGPYPKSELEK